MKVNKVMLGNKKINQGDSITYMGSIIRKDDAVKMQKV